MSDELERRPSDGEGFAGLLLDAAAGPARRIDDALLQELVGGALQRVPLRRSGWRRKGAAPLIGVGVIVISTAAAAAAGLGPRLLAALTGQSAPNEVAHSAPNEALPGAGRAGIHAAQERAQLPAERLEAPAERLEAPAEQPAAQLGAAAALVGANVTAPSERARPRGAASSDAREPGQAAASLSESRDGASTAARHAGRSTSTAAAANVGEPASPVLGPAAMPIVAAQPHQSAESGGTRSSSAAQSTEPSTARALPEDLLARANRLRKAQAYRDALGVYELVLNRYPGTRQAEIARVAAAQIELEQFGDAEKAERHFRAAESDSALGPEALFGLAEAGRARGDRAAEHRALQRLIAKYPDNPLAAAAKKRLASAKQR